MIIVYVAIKSCPIKSYLALLNLYYIQCPFIHLCIFICAYVYADARKDFVYTMLHSRQLTWYYNKITAFIYIFIYVYILMQISHVDNGIYTHAWVSGISIWLVYHVSWPII